MSTVIESPLMMSHRIWQCYSKHLFKRDAWTIRMNVANMLEAWKEKHGDDFCVEGIANQKEINAIMAEAELLRGKLESVLEFVPEGWPMPLGFSDIAADARALIASRKKEK